MLHTFFISSAANGHLGWLHVLALVNRDAVNTEVWMREAPVEGVYLGKHTVVQGTSALASLVSPACVPTGDPLFSLPLQHLSPSDP